MSRMPRRLWRCTAIAASPASGRGPRGDLSHPTPSPTARFIVHACVGWAGGVGPWPGLDGRRPRWLPSGPRRHDHPDVEARCGVVAMGDGGSSPGEGWGRRSSSPGLATGSEGLGPSEGHRPDRGHAGRPEPAYAGRRRSTFPSSGVSGFTTAGRAQPRQGDREVLMYTHNGEGIFVVDGHVHFWDASPANWRDPKYAEGWINCFYDYHRNLSPAEYVWTLEEYRKYPEERMMRDIFEEGYVDIAIFLPTALKDFYLNGFNTLEQDAVLKQRHPERFVLC